MEITPDRELGPLLVEVFRNTHQQFQFRPKSWRRMIFVPFLTLPSQPLCQEPGFTQLISQLEVR